jgi:hypothetical protein
MATEREAGMIKRLPGMFFYVAPQRLEQARTWIDANIPGATVHTLYDGFHVSQGGGIEGFPAVLHIEEPTLAMQFDAWASGIERGA